MRVLVSKDLKELREEKTAVLDADQLFQELDTKMATLEEVKAAKDAQLVYLCDFSIRQGFISKALGTAHTYPSDMEAQANLQSSIKRLENEPSKEVVIFKTMEAGFLPHTLEQLRQVLNDGFDHGENMIIRRELLRTQVEQAKNVQEVVSIVW
ncbi:hypothetical protein [Tumebacillus sp. BK434]|uniref:DUF4376 domain-containing protein n=1 Tax=Tumebacillus sp. BK434 TaxID=2512169 RepID=UPI00104CB69C|nr:hypothetical protein [Tumebacillus sp. BK434]